MIDDRIKSTVFSQLEKTPIYEGIKTALFRVETIAVSLAEKTGEEKLTGLKVGTILACAVLKKVSEGKSPKKFTKEDWMEIANAVADFAVVMDNQQYSEFVFLLYSEYIDFSVKCLPLGIKEETRDSILSLAVEIRDQTELLKRGELIETEYIEKCLWICLEAIIKLMSSYSELVMPSEFSELSKAIVAFSYEYGRLIVYRKELSVLDECLESQHELDALLDEQYSSYASEINIEAENFILMVNDAFKPGLRERLLKSAEVARMTGVEESQILDTIDKVDDFFL